MTNVGDEIFIMILIFIGQTLLNVNDMVNRYLNQRLYFDDNGTKRLNVRSAEIESVRC